jgi:hypothetical protein
MAESGGRFCPLCGEAAGLQDRFCRRCGESLLVSAPPLGEGQVPTRGDANGPPLPRRDRASWLGRSGCTGTVITTMTLSVAYAVIGAFLGS